jgi:hypothetical protein
MPKKRTLKIVNNSIVQYEEHYHLDNDHESFPYQRIGAAWWPDLEYVEEDVPSVP